MAFTSIPAVRRLVIEPQDASVLVEAAGVARGGGVLIYPTETVYGLGGDGLDPVVRERIERAKGRSPDKPLPLIAADGAMVEALGVVYSPLAARLAERFWPGPLSLVLPLEASAPARAAAPEGTVAVRVPASSVARELARLVGRPLFATSANLAGRPPAMAVEELDMALLRGVDLVLDGGPLPFSLPSTVVDVTGPHPRVLRSGAVGTEALTDALGQAAREPQRS